MPKFGANPGGPMARFATWPIRALYGRADAVGCISHAIEQEAHGALCLRTALPRVQQGPIEQSGRGLRGLSHAAGYADPAPSGNRSRVPDAQQRS